MTTGTAVEPPAPGTAALPDAASMAARRTWACTSVANNDKVSLLFGLSRTEGGGASRSRIVSVLIRPAPRTDLARSSVLKEEGASDQPATLLNRHVEEVAPMT